VQKGEQKKHQEQEYVVLRRSSGNWCQCQHHGELLSKVKKKYTEPLFGVSWDMRVKRRL